MTLPEYDLSKTGARVLTYPKKTTEICNKTKQKNTKKTREKKKKKKKGGGGGGVKRICALLLFFVYSK